MAFPLDTPYYPIPGSQSEATFGAVVEMLLKARLKLHLERDPSFYDEDVNTYLAGVLISYIDPAYLRSISDFLSQYDLDVCQQVNDSQDRAHVYQVYKVNADDLLLSLGIFKRIWQEAPGELVRVKRYYAMACEYQKRIYGKATAVSEIQTKLAGWTERYLDILGTARGDYLHLIEQIPPEELDVFRQRLTQHEKELPLKNLQDEFLDLYSKWQNGIQDPETHQRLLQLVQNLTRLDPNFKIDINF